MSAMVMNPALDEPALQPPNGQVSNLTNQSEEQYWYHWLYVAQILYAPTIFFVKSAILLQYLRLLAPTRSANRTLYISCRVIIVLTLVYYIISTAITIFACSPREKMWNPLITDGHCLNNNAGVLFTSLFNIVSDIVILVLPARSVWKLQIPRAKKIKIVALFATGLLACVANMMIIFYAVRIGQKDADVSYNSAFMGFWVFAEISLGIIVTCTFSLPKLVETMRLTLRKTPVHSTTTDPSSFHSTTLERVTASKTHSEARLTYDAGSDTPEEHPVLLSQQYRSGPAEHQKGTETYLDPCLRETRRKVNGSDTECFRHGNAV
ncbi:MAG: hypothetical protein Q9226_005587 [Calogaya cf. arnoldii]